MSLLSLLNNLMHPCWIKQILLTPNFELYFMLYLDIKYCVGEHWWGGFIWLLYDHIKLTFRISFFMLDRFNTMKQDNMDECMLNISCFWLFFCERTGRIMNCICSWCDWFFVLSSMASNCSSVSITSMKYYNWM